MRSQRAPEGRAESPPELAAVEEWQGLRGEPKIAWRHIWELAGRRVETTVVVTASWIGGRQGTSDRGGDRALKALAAEGLIELVERLRGRWTIFLPSPLDVARARRSRGSDGQGELFERDEPAAEEPTSPPTVSTLKAHSAEVAPLPPRRADFDLDFSARAYKDLDLDLKDLDLKRSAQRYADPRSQSPITRGGGSGATSAAAEAAGCQRLGDVLALRPAAPHTQERPERRMDSLEAYVRYLRQRVGDVGDEGKFAAFAIRVAALAFSSDGRFSDETVSSVLQSLDYERDRGTLGSAWKFFQGCIRRKLDDKKLSLPTV